MLSYCCCVSTLHAIFLCHNVYYYVILTYHDPFLLIHGEWSLFMANAAGVLVCFLVQLFYTRMIYHRHNERQVALVIDDRTCAADLDASRFWNCNGCRRVRLSYQFIQFFA
ncbi:hypothetical protein EWM64_g2230 [Hericium alpestre]|uniref:Uncharacterized protein n=1 Tax=Hericium alpestre TaxID=135208 RepID=A0A4Z0A432_9AGAM|nr:hypothetical protein EWM64_g2230 [Hericium alpestre]